MYKYKTLKIPEKLLINWRKITFHQTGFNLHPFTWSIPFPLCHSTAHCRILRAQDTVRIETRRIKGGVILPPGNPEPDQPPQTNKLCKVFAHVLQTWYYLWLMVFWKKNKKNSFVSWIITAFLRTNRPILHNMNRDWPMHFSGLARRLQSIHNNWESQT